MQIPSNKTLASYKIMFSGELIDKVARLGCGVAQLWSETRNGVLLGRLGM